MTSPPPVDEASEAGEALRRIVAERLTAVTTKDAVTLAARQAPDMIAFDVLPPLQAHGSAEGESRTRAWFDSYAGDIG